MQQSLYGLRGIVTDSCTGHPIEAQVFITGHDYDNSHVYSRLPVGNYHRPLIAGNYAVTYSAPGYTSKTISNITISNNTTTIKDVSLAPVKPSAEFTSNKTVINAGESIQFTDMSSNNTNSWLWNFEGGTPGSSTLQNPVIIYNLPGTYYVSLTAANGCMSDVKLKNNLIQVNPLSVYSYTISHTELKLYPNPVKDELFVKLPEAGKDAQLFIYDVLGNLISTFQIKNSSDVLKLNISYLNAGIYYLRCVEESNIFIGKFFK